MMSPLSTWLLFLPGFFLVLVRVTGLMLAAPVFGSQSIPVRIKAAASIAIAFSVFPAVLPQLPAVVDLRSVLLGIPGELAMGFIMGLGMSLLFLGLELAGLAIGQQAGLSLGQIFNPALDTNSTIMGQVFFIVGMSAFLVLGGHREMVAGVLDTFQTIPPLTFEFSEQALAVLLVALQSAFQLALRISGPALLALLVSTMAMGFVSRTIPQLNILSVGFSVKATIALGIAGIVITASSDLLIDQMSEMLALFRETINQPFAAAGN
jgi:flagellar biosynthetic protein FliR